MSVAIDLSEIARARNEAELGAYQRATGNAYVGGSGRSRTEHFPVRPASDPPAIIYAPNGAAMLNRKKMRQKWAWLRADAFPLVLGAGGGATTAFTAPAEENMQGDLELVKLMSTQTGRFSVFFTQATTTRSWMNVAIPHNFIFGTAQLPGVLYESCVLETTTSLQMQVADLSGAPNTIRMVGEGRRTLDYGEERGPYLQAYYAKKTHPFWLSFDQGAELAVGAGAAVEAVMTVPGAGHFEVWHWMTDSTGTYDIEILEGNSARSQMLGGAVAALDFVASPTVAVIGMPGGIVRAVSLPHIITYSMIYPANSRVRIRITDTSGAPNVVRLCAHGRLIYADGSDPASVASAYSPGRIMTQPIPTAPRPVPPGSGLPGAPHFSIPGGVSVPPGMHGIPGMPGRRFVRRRPR